MLHYHLYENENSKEWVTFIHGAGGSSSIWYRQLKAYKEHFNVLLVDLRGHGRSHGSMLKKLKRYTFEVLSKDVIDVLDHLGIQQSHFVGISLGTIIIHEIADQHPGRVKSMVLSGAILKLDLRSQLLMRLGFWLKSLVPYLLLYRLFAYIIMPKKKHRKSRNLFIREAKKLYQKEFIRWFKLTAEVNPILKLFRSKPSSIPVLYLMGAEDYMFLPSIEVIAGKNPYAELQVIPDCGHVVNVDQPEEFNKASLTFLQAE